MGKVVIIKRDKVLVISKIFILEEDDQNYFVNCRKGLDEIKIQDDDFSSDQVV